MELVVNATEGINRAARILREGGLVAVPTETVYGLAADATNGDAVAKIYAAKGRPSFNPLIIHVDGVEMAKRYGRFDERAIKLAERFWPGPLTLVLPLAESHGLAPAVTAGLDSVAMRQPSGPMAELATLLDRPLAAPSANSSGRISPTLAQHVAVDLGTKVDLILDNGPCPVGLESTIISLVGETALLLREGGLDRSVAAQIVGPLVKPKPDANVAAPGMLSAHYAPRIPLLRDFSSPMPEGMAFLGFGEDMHEPGLNLSPSGDVNEAARNLFAMMQELDRSGARSIGVAPIPHHGLGAAINDRLQRAANGSGDGDGR
ncbi:MAG: L-threonylcarbamoyladenylate synthase [Pseudomonadota bacterium]